MNQADKSKEIKIKQYILSSEDLKNSALFTVCTSVLLWFIKAIYHCYWMGKFSVYHIEKCYIEINSDNTILEVLYVVLGIIVVGICNYLHYNIVKKSGNDEKWKRRIGFYCIQSLFAFVFIIIYSNISMNEFWKETTIVQKLAIYVFSIILCFIINICSILESTSKEYSSKKEKKILNEKKFG